MGIEEKSAGMRNPGGYLKAAAKRAGFGPQGGPGDREQMERLAERDFEKIEKRVRWLNHNVFSANPIDDNALDALAQLGLDAFSILKEAEEKADSIKNISGYLKRAATN